ncbi:ATP-grasp fold amidoligase family protein [Jannaschia formosa]|uniref:ATP-grasp fold amidoligase family protein n=1 Tax=Jannaschia formosa TaxID=2259592 RepID=UPI000E1C321A|nr:ATP-grasp fold amidoligase family protein [Jannaschia formosa]TFL18854.1 hypothetical protein DR046_08005 [Jannaschia formosa]
MPELFFHPDGGFDQSFSACPPTLDDVALTRAEAQVFARTEAWIAETHAKLRWRACRLDPANDQQGLRVALPRTINEKFTWRKVFDRNPLFPAVIDKIAVKDWLAAERMPLAAPRLIWQGTDPEAIPDTALGRLAVAKAAHGWQAQLFLTPGETTLADLRAAGHRFMAHRHGWRQFEWGYGPIPPRILIEERVRPAPGRRLEEVEVYVFGDRIERVLRIFDRFGTPTGQFWAADAEGRVRLSRDLPETAQAFDPAPLPPNWQALIRAAQQLAAPFDHIRIDLLTDGESAHVGEMTLYNGGGRLAGIGADPRHPAARAWDLRRSWFLRTPQPEPALEEYRLTLRCLLDRLAPAPRSGMASTAPLPSPLGSVPAT